MTMPHRASLRCLWALVPVLALVAALASCSQLSNEPSPYTLACGVVLDGSGSAAADPQGFDAAAKYKATLGDFLTDRKCGVLDFAPITKASLSSPCRYNAIDLDPDVSDNADRDRARATARIAALVQAKRMLECAQKHHPGSDVLGGLSVIAKARHAHKAFDVLVVSDFDQGDANFRLGDQDLSTPESRTAAIDALLADHGTPQLAGADLYPVGYGMSTRLRKAVDFPLFDAFWTQLLEKRIKAHVHSDYRN